MINPILFDYSDMLPLDPPASLLPMWHVAVHLKMAGDQRGELNIEMLMRLERRLMIRRNFGEMKKYLIQQALLMDELCQ